MSLKQCDIVVLSFKSSDETLVCENSIKSSYTVLLCGTVILTKMFLTLKSVDVTPVCDHSNESY